MYCQNVWKWRPTEGEDVFLLRNEVLCEDLWPGATARHIELHICFSLASSTTWKSNNTGRVNGLQWPWHRHRENKSEKFQYNRVTTSCPQTQTKSQKPFCIFKTCFKGLFRSKMSLYPNSMSTLHPIRLSIHSAGILVTIILVRSIAVVFLCNYALTSNNQ